MAQDGGGQTAADPVDGDKRFMGSLKYVFRPPEAIDEPCKQMIADPRNAAQPEPGYEPPCGEVGCG